MDIQFVRADPTGNITALVESFSGAGEAAAEAVFASDGSIEQLGFLHESEKGDVGLRMAGGEFCGNACLCAAAWHMRRCGLERSHILVDISGAESPIVVDMERVGENDYAGALNMPLPLDIKYIETDFGSAPLLRFPGICHLITPASLGKERAEELIVPLCRQLGAEALGLMLFDEAESRLAPLVYVPGADTLCWEHSCASGSSAVGAWLACEAGESRCLSLRQSGGKLGISAAVEDGALRTLRLSGRVSLGEREIIKI